MASQYVIVDRLDTIIENLELMDADLIEQVGNVIAEQQEQGKLNRETLRAVAQLIINVITDYHNDFNEYRIENNLLLQEISTKLDKLDNIVTKLDKVDGTTLEIDTSLLAQQVTSNYIKNGVDDIKEIVEAINTKQGTSSD